MEEKKDNKTEHNLIAKAKECNFPYEVIELFEHTTDEDTLQELNRIFNSKMHKEEWDCGNL